MPPVSRLVVLAPNWLGDVVMALPAVCDIRRHFPAATIAVAARPGLVPLLESVTGVGEVVKLATSGKPWRHWRVDASTLRLGRFDLAIVLPNSFYTAWIARRAGIPGRWGYRGDLRGPLLTRRVRRPRGTIHRAARYQRLVRELEFASGPLTPHVAVPDRDRMAGGLRLAGEGWIPSVPLVGLAPGAAFGFAKQWPPRHFAALARRLAERGIWSVVVGLAADRGAARQLMDEFTRSVAGTRVPGRVLNLTGRTTMRELMGLMTRCSAFVANDSGAGYLAAAIDLPVAVLFGPTHERVATPLPNETFTGPQVALTHPVFCSPCGLRECPIDHRCMTRIEPDRVFQAVLEQLVEQGAA
jgi:heptosyltransferase-2